MQYLPQLDFQTNSFRRNSSIRKNSIVNLTEHMIEATIL